MIRCAASFVIATYVYIRLIPQDFARLACGAFYEAVPNWTFFNFFTRASPLKIRIIQAIARKEAYHLIRDARSLYLAFAIPLLLILLFGYALSLDVENIPTIIVDQDKTDLSRDFIRRLDASDYFSVIAHLPDSRAVTQYLDHSRASLAVIIPPGWTQKLRSDRETAVQVLLDGSDPNFANIARGYITAWVERYNQKALVSFLNRRGMENIKPPLEGRIRVWFNENLESRNFIIPGIIAVIIMIVGAMLTSLVVAREYENGTMETLRSLPITGPELMTGKAIPYFFIALTDVLVAVLMGQMLFGVVMKAGFWLLILASSIYILVALMLGLLISIVTKSQLVANQAAVLITYLPSLLLSNFVFPVVNMPKVLQLLTCVVPATYYIEILSGIYLKDLTLARMWPSFLVLTGMFVFLMLLNLIAMKREGL
jgi:ABC-2 type transport system permease protein